MQRTLKHRLASWASLVAVVLGSALVFILIQLSPLLHRVVAYKTKQTASLVLVGGQTQTQAEAEINEDHAQLKWARVHIDSNEKIVSGSLLGFFRQTAHYHPDFGTVLLNAKGKPPFPQAVREHLNNTPNDSTAADPAGAPSDFDSVISAGDRIFEEPTRPTSVSPDGLWHRRTRAVLIAHAGRVVYERYAPGFDASSRFLGWSMTKSVLGLLTMMRIEDGHLHLNKPTAHTAWTQSPNDPRRGITLHHLMTMTSGLYFTEDYGPESDAVKMLYGQPDMAHYAMTKPLVSEDAVGQIWNYSSGSANLVALSLRQSFSGDELAYLNYPYGRLFKPLGMTSAVLELDASGTFVGSSSMFATARDWLKIGQLVLQEGLWQTKQLLSPESLQYLMSPAQPNRAPSRSPQGMRYGALWWLNRPDPNTGVQWMPEVPEDAVAASGHFGQALVIVPSLDLVVLRLGLSKGATWSTRTFITEIVHALPDPQP